MNTGKILANTKVNVYKRIPSKSNSGGVIFTEELKYENVLAKLESVEVDIPIDLAGASYRQYVLMHTWTDNKNILYNIQDNDLIYDIVSQKTYKALEPKAGSLFKQKPYKLETKLIELKDDRYINLEGKHL